MDKFLTIKELIEILNKYDGDSIPVILRDGNGHYAALRPEFIELEESIYFPDSTDFPKDTQFVKIGII